MTSQSLHFILRSVGPTRGMKSENTFSSNSLPVLGLSLSYDP